MIPRIFHKIFAEPRQNILEICAKLHHIPNKFYFNILVVKEKIHFLIF